MRTSIKSLPDAPAELDRIRLALPETVDVRQIKDLRDRAEAARAYVKSAGLGLEMQNQAAEVRLLAERRAGEVLLAMRLHGGRTSAGSRGVSDGQRRHWLHCHSLGQAAS